MVDKKCNIREDSHSNLVIKFEEEISNELSIFLEDCHCESLAKSKDLTWKLPVYKGNHEYVICILEYLEKNSYILEIEDIIQQNLKNVVSDEDLENLKRLGKKIKSVEYKDEIILPGFNPERNLHDYQKMPVQHLVSMKNVANFSVPGSGKTMMVLSGYSILKNEGFVDSLLIIGPYNSFWPWEQEIAECFVKPPKHKRINGDLSNRLKVYLNPEDDSEVYLLTYHTAYRDIQSKYLLNFLKKSNRKFMIVLDESHYIKNIKGSIANIILDLAIYGTSKIIL